MQPRSVVRFHSPRLHAVTASSPSRPLFSPTKLNVHTKLAWGTCLGNDDIGHGFTLHRDVRTPLEIPGAFATIPISLDNRGIVSGVVIDSNGRADTRNEAL